MDLMSQINAIGLEWYSTLTGRPAAPPPPTTPAMTPGTQGAAALLFAPGNYTGLLVVGGVLALVGLLIYLVLR